MTEPLSPAETAAVDPIEGIIAVLDRGQATGTNKFSLLLALIELAPLAGADRRIELAAIAEQMLRIHWDQVAPFPAADLGGDLVLSQVTSGNREATAVTEVLRLQSLLPPGLRHLALDRVRGEIPQQEWQGSVRRVRAAALRNPVQHLQRIDGVVIPFLFTLDAAHDALVLTPAAAAELTRYGPVLKELIQSRFTRVVLHANRALQRTDVAERLTEHLFGAQRQMPGPALRRELAALQGGVCVYTGRTLPDNGAPLDHVVPWARVRLSTLGNLVATTRTVNSAKRDLLPAAEPLARWVEHLQRRHDGLAALAQEFSWPADPAQTLDVATRLYRGLRPGAVLWSPAGTHPATHEELRNIARVLAA